MIRLQLFDRNGTTLLGVLADATSWQLSMELSDVGALQFEYPLSGINASQIEELREVAIINNSNAAELKNGRYVITSIDRERADVDGVISVTARSILWRFETALAYPDGGAGSGNKRTFTSAAPGAVLKTLIDAAQARGALSGLTYTFGNTTDSNSAAWVGTVTQEYSARNTLLSIMRSLTELGQAEYETTGRELRACIQDGIGTDKTTGANPVVLRYGQNLTEAPEKRNAERIAGVALIESDNDVTVERVNATTNSTYGRLEASLTASGVTGTSAIQALGDAYLATLTGPARQLTVGLTLQDGLPKPLIDFNVGDYVYTQTVAGLERLRVRQITVSMSGGALDATATLGDRIYEADIKFARRLAGLTANSANAGSAGAGDTPTPSVDPSYIDGPIDSTPDSLAPSAPTSLTGSSSAYNLAGSPLASVALSWTPPTTNSDSSALTDLRGYRVFMRTSGTAPWTFVAETSAASITLTDFAVNTSYRFQVRAIDASNNESAGSNEFTITTATITSADPTPSTPTATSRLGTITINWNGLSSTGANMGSNFSHVEVHVSTTSNFTPSSGTYQGRLSGSDFFILSNLTYNTTYYTKLVAVSKTGVSSTASNQATATIQPLVNTDIIDASLSGAKFAGGTINTAQLADGSISASKILTDAVTQDKIAANAIGADEIAANAIVAGKIAANAVTAGTIAALAVSAGNIQANAITADKIEAGAITTVKLAANAITADKIAAGTITTDKLVAGSLTGYTITNGTTFNVTSTGVVTASSGTIGGFAIGSTIIGDGSGTYISTSGAAAFNGLVTLRATGTAISMQNGGNITMGGGNVSGAGTLSGTTISGTTVSASSSISSSGSISASTSLSGATITISGRSDLNGTVFMPGIADTTNAANMRWGTTGAGQIFYSTASSQRFKQDIVDLIDVNELDPKQLLQLPVRAFRYKDDYLSQDDDRSGVLVPGFIAEEMDQIYPIATDYDENGPVSWNERFMVPAMLSLIQDLYAQIDELKGNS